MFATKLKELRNLNGYTQEVLAQKINVSRSTIAKWESGRGLPTKESLDDIARLFNVDINELVNNNSTEMEIIKKNIKINRLSITLIIGGILFGITLALCTLAMTGGLGYKANKKSESSNPPIVDNPEEKENKMFFRYINSDGTFDPYDDILFSYDKENEMFYLNDIKIKLKQKFIIYYNGNYLPVNSINIDVDFFHGSYEYISLEEGIFDLKAVNLDWNNLPEIDFTRKTTAYSKLSIVSSENEVFDLEYSEITLIGDFKIVCWYVRDITIYKKSNRTYKIIDENNERVPLELTNSNDKYFTINYDGIYTWEDISFSLVYIYGSDMDFRYFGIN